VTERFLIDSNIHDKIIDVPGALDLVTQLVDDGAITLLSTYIQADEIARTPDKQRLARLMTVPTGRGADVRHRRRLLAGRRGAAE
jgi:hypothetical protein